MEMQEILCSICGRPAQWSTNKNGNFVKRPFSLYRCSSCTFFFVSDPVLDWATLYDEAYYKGEGADPLVDYYFELMNPEQTIRNYEWIGLVKIAQALMNVKPDTLWFDYGCGNGGLVRYLNTRGVCQATGWDQGAIVARALEERIPIVSSDEMGVFAGKCDIVTAIEVLEHMARPMELFNAVRRLLKKGGLFFFTTGNNQPFRNNMEQWSYVVPEIHISFFSPMTVVKLMQDSGFEPKFHGFLPGWESIFKYKVFKKLGFRKLQDGKVMNLLPWSLVARLINLKVRLTDFPVGIAV